MKDLLVNFIGAVVFSVIGYVTLKSDRFVAITDKLVWRPVSKQEQREQEEEILRRKKLQRERRRRKKKQEKKSV